MRFGAFLIIALVHGEDGSEVESEDFLFGLVIFVVVVGNGEDDRGLTVTDVDVLLVTGGLRGVMARSNSSSFKRS